MGGGPEADSGPALLGGDAGFNDAARHGRPVGTEEGDQMDQNYNFPSSSESSHQYQPATTSSQFQGRTLFDISQYPKDQVLNATQLRRKVPSPRH